jgi:hypothetical protein
MFSTLRATAALSIVALSVSGQQPEPSAESAPEPVLIRADDLAVLRFDGPARLRMAFLPTNLGSMLAGVHSTDFWQLLRGGLRERLRALDAELGPSLAAWVEELGSHGGAIHLALARTPHPEAWAGIAPNLGGVLLIEPDGRTDLPALAARVRDALRASRHAVERVNFGGREFEVLKQGERGGVVLPTMVGARLCTFFGENLEAVVGPRLLGEGEPFVADRDFARAPLALRIDLAALVAQEFAGPGYEVGSVDTALLGRVSGLASLREFRLLLRPAGPQVELESSVAFVEGAGRGLFGGLLPAQQGAPALVGLVPEDTRFWYAGRLDPGVTFAALVDSFAAYMVSDPAEFEARAAGLREQVREVTKVDLEAEVFGRLNGDALIFGSVGGRLAEEGGEPADPARLGADAGTLLCAFGARDEAALETALLGFFASDISAGGYEEREVAGATLRVDDISAWAVADGIFLFAGGDEAEAWAVAFLERLARLRGDPEARSKLPRAVERRLPQAPPGFQGCGALDAGTLLGLPVLEILDLEDALGDLIGPGLGGALQGLRPLFAEHGLERAYALSGWADDRWRYRVLW